MLSHRCRQHAVVDQSCQQVSTLEEGEAICVAVVCDARSPVERRPAPPHVLLVDGRRPLLNQEPRRLQLQTVEAQALLDCFHQNLVGSCQQLASGQQAPTAQSAS